MHVTVTHITEYSLYVGLMAGSVGVLGNLRTPKDTTSQQAAGSHQAGVYACVTTPLPALLAGPIAQMQNINPRTR